MLLTIDELLLITKTSMSDDSLTMQERLEQASEAFNRVIHLQRKIKVPLEELANTLINYALLLDDFNMFDDMFPLYIEVLEIYKSLSDMDSDNYLPKVAMTLYFLAKLHETFNQYDLAEKEYNEALEIYRLFFLKEPFTYGYRIASVLNSLANLHSTLKKYDLAEKEYNIVLKRYRFYVFCAREKVLQRENHGFVDLCNVAMALNNLAILHVAINKYDLAEKEHNEALEILRTLVEKHPEAYLPDLAQTLNNIAVLHYNINQYDLAEKEYNESLELRRTLAEKHPEAYLPDLAQTLNNLAVLHDDINKYDLAEKEYNEALLFRRIFFIKFPNAYYKQICQTLYSFGDMMISKRIDEERGKQYIIEAHKIATENHRQDFVDEINAKYGSFFK